MEKGNTSLVLKFEGVFNPSRMPINKPIVITSNCFFKSMLIISSSIFIKIVWLKEESKSKPILEIVRI